MGMKKYLLAAAALAASLSLPGTAAASTLINGGFEGSPAGPGAPAGWTTNDPTLVQVVTSFSGSSWSFSAAEGSQFAVLTAGPAANIATVLSQIFTLNAGETISFMVAFATSDYLPFDDSGAFGIFDFTSFTGTTLFTQTVGGVGDYNASPWTLVSFTAPTTGTYALNASVRNNLDGSNASYLLLDAAGAVPEPGTWLLMLLGFGAVGFSMRRRKNTRVSFA